MSIAELPGAASALIILGALAALATAWLHGRHIGGRGRPADARDADHVEPDGPRYHRFIENIQEGYFFYSHDTQGRFNYLSPSITRYHRRLGRNRGIRGGNCTGRTRAPRRPSTLRRETRRPQPGLRGGGNRCDARLGNPQPANAIPKPPWLNASWLSGCARVMCRVSFALNE